MLARLLFVAACTLAVSGALSAQTTFTVTTTANDGPGSLRQAILDANANAGADVIAFAIPGDGPHTIQPFPALPAVLDPVTIDALTQPGADCSTWPATLQVELDGSQAPANSSGLLLLTDDSRVQGLVINRFTNRGIDLRRGGGHTIACNYIGTDPSGTVDLGNGFLGILVDGASGTTIGGTEPGTRNLISGNGLDGIAVSNGATGVVIQGNYIGSDVTGLLPLGNDFQGVVVFSGPTTVGGPTEAARNVIVDNGLFGVGLQDSDGSLVQGNYIGIGADGQTPLGTRRDSGSGTGVFIQRASDNRVLGNVISSNADDGVAIRDGSARNVVQGNLIGTDATGTLDRGNADDGVDTGDDTQDNVIGGLGAGEGNTIAFSREAGIELEGTRNAILGNRVYGNEELGIDLGNDGVTPNDAGDADEGANRLQNTPDLTGATGDGASTLTVRYTVDTALANAAYPLTVAFFLADADGEEGQVFLGTDTYAAAQTSREVAFNPAQVVPAGSRLVATATDGDGHTSEFSASVAVMGSVASEEEAVPGALALDLAGPNPFRRATTLALTMTETDWARVAVYDMLGRRVAVLHDGPLTVGTHRLALEADALSAGVYVVRAAVRGAVVTRALTVVR